MNGHDMARTFLAAYGPTHDPGCVGPLCPVDVVTQLTREHEALIAEHFAATLPDAIPAVPPEVKAADHLAACLVRQRRSGAALGPAVARALDEYERARS